MAAEDKAGPARPTSPFRPQLADEWRGDMVSGNRAANERFKRSSKAMQQHSVSLSKDEGQQAGARTS